MTQIIQQGLSAEGADRIHEGVLDRMISDFIRKSGVNPERVAVLIVEIEPQHSPLPIRLRMYFDFTDDSPLPKIVRGLVRRAAGRALGRTL